MRMDRDFGFHSGCGMLPEHTRHVTDRLSRSRRLLDQLHEHDLSRLRAGKAIARHEHAVPDARVVGDDEANTGLVVQPADDLLRAPLQDLCDRAFRTPAEIDACRTHGDAIAVNDLEHLTRRQKDRRRAIFRHHEAVAILMRAHDTYPERQELAQAVLAAAVAHELARLDQCFELHDETRSRRPTRPLETLGKLIEREWTPGILERLEDRLRSFRWRGSTRFALSAGSGYARPTRFLLTVHASYFLLIGPGIAIDTQIRRLYIGAPSCGTHPAFPLSCPGGGTGRRAGFRYQWSDPWRFESSPGHQP